MRALAALLGLLVWILLAAGPGIAIIWIVIHFARKFW